VVREDALVNEITRSCGCLHRAWASELGRKRSLHRDLTGKRYGLLVATSLSDHKKNGSRAWNCLCDCGVTKVVREDALVDGRTRSCGCWQKSSASSLDRAKTAFWKMVDCPAGRCALPRRFQENRLQLYRFLLLARRFRDRHRAIRRWPQRQGGLPFGSSLKRDQNRDVPASA
jgi:hypothetical protein